MAARHSTAQDCFPSNIKDALQRSASLISLRNDEGGCGFYLTEMANSKIATDALSDLIPLYFHRLASSRAVAALSLLHYFLLEREVKELRQSKTELEEYLVKIKIGTTSEARDPDATSLLDQSKIQALSNENARLKAAHSELFRINKQWALDYDELAKQKRANLGHVPPDAGLCQVHCDRCRQLEGLVANLNSNIASLKQDMRHLASEKDHIVRMQEDENRALQIQLKEVGDLNEILKLKGDLKKLRMLLKQKDAQYQEVVSHKMKAQDQIQRLQSAIFQVLSLQCGRQRNRPSALNLSRLDNALSSRPPPTPPGLLSRECTLHMNSPVEKDRRRSSNGDSGITSEDNPALICPTCGKVTAMVNGSPEGYSRWIEHIQRCEN